MPRDRDIGRHYPSGSKKRALQHKKQESAKKQCGLMQRFLVPAESSHRLDLDDGKS